MLQFHIRVLPRVETFKEHYQPSNVEHFQSTTPSPEAWLQKFYSKQIIPSKRRSDREENEAGKSGKKGKIEDKETLPEFIVVPSLPSTDLNTLDLIKPTKVCL